MTRLHRQEALRAERDDDRARGEPRQRARGRRLPVGRRRSGEAHTRARDVDEPRAPLGRDQRYADPVRHGRAAHRFPDGRLVRSPARLRGTRTSRSSATRTGRSRARSTRRPRSTSAASLRTRRTTRRLGPLLVGHRDEARARSARTGGRTTRPPALGRIRRTSTRRGSASLHRHRRQRANDG